MHKFKKTKMKQSNLKAARVLSVYFSLRLSSAALLSDVGREHAYLNMDGRLCWRLRNPSKAASAALFWSLGSSAASPT